MVGVSGVWVRWLCGLRLRLGLGGCGFGIGVAAGFMLWCVVCAPEMACSFSFLFFIFWVFGRGCGGMWVDIGVVS